MGSNGETLKGDISDFAAQMKKIVNNKDMSDIKFLIGSTRKPVYAHRCILSARCEVFRAMFADAPSASKTAKDKDGEVPFVLSDMTVDIFLPVLEYIYTNCVTLNAKVAIDVLGTSIEYGLEGLRKLCVDYISENLSVNNASTAMQAAVTYKQDELKDRSLEYIEDNTENVFKAKSFHEMSDVALALVLQSDNLLIDELKVIQGVREWASVNHVVMSKPVSQIAKRVVGHIRLPLLSPQELKDVEEENKKDKLMPVELLSNAWKYHALHETIKGDPLTTPRRGTAARDSNKTLGNL